ncbi:hypothetical protein ACJW31_01G284600 [Castanea mollissima]
MTVKHVNESDLQKPKKVVIQSPEVELRVNSGDLLAGKDVPKRKVTTMKYVHSQILKIREEDSHLGEDFGLGLKEHSHHHHHHHHLYHHDHDRDRDHDDDVESATEVVMFTKPILPSSPLSGKTTTTTTVKSLH